MPVTQTGVYPHMPIGVTTNSLQHWPSRFVAVQWVCHTELTTV